MLYPSSEYAYVNEYGQPIDPSNAYNDQFYVDQQEQMPQQVFIESNPYDNQQVELQPQTHLQSVAAPVQNYQTILNNGSQPLAKCSVLYLGTAISSAGQRGIDAIQEPLSRRYPIDGREMVRGVEAWLAIYENGLQLQFARDPSVVIFYPIRSLVYCASIRFATRTQTGAEFPNGWRFVPLDSPAAARVENTRNPPLFAATFRRTRHLPADECFCFVTKTKQAALALVQACFSAYQATSADQDCSKVPLYFKVDDYGSKNKEIDNEIRLVPAPDRERTLDYQTNTEGSGFFYKTDRVLIDTWQLWEHHKHEIKRSGTAKNRSSLSRSRSYSGTSSSSSSYSSTSSSCSSCRQNRRSRSRSRSRNRRRRLASIASISAMPQPQPQLQSQPIHSSSSHSVMIQPIATTPTNGSLQPSATAKTVDPYAPAPNLIRVERIKDVNTGQDVFIRWVSDTNPITSDDQQQQLNSHPQQIYSTRPPATSNTMNHQDEELPDELERLALDDEYLRKSLHFDQPISSRQSNFEEKIWKKRSKKSKRRDIETPDVGYEVIEGFFEDRQGKKRPVKLDRTRINTIKDYRYPMNEQVNSSAPNRDRHHSYQATPVAPMPPPNSFLPFSSRPLTTPFLPANPSFYSRQNFNTTPLFSTPAYLPRFAYPSQTPYWYRPM